MSRNLGQQPKKSARVQRLISAGLIVTLFCALSAFGQNKMQVIPEVKHDTSPSLRDLESSLTTQAISAPRRVIPLRLPHPVTKAAPMQADTALQKVDLPLVSATPGLNFEGLGDGQFGFVVNAAPPDTNGTVGSTPYVQWVTRSVALSDKVPGAKPLVPAPGHAFSSGL